MRDGAAHQAAMRRVLVCLVIAGGACASSSEVDALRADQRRLLDRIEKLEKRAAESDRKGRAARGPDPDRIHQVPVGNAPVQGRADAPITIVEFGDFQCPFCGRVQPTLRRLQLAYGDALRIAWKHHPLPFHDRAMPAALAAECAHAQGRFWQMHDALFGDAAALSDEDMSAAAQGLGLDVEKWHACRDGPAARARVEADVRLAAELGARGTPMFFINGRALSGAQPYEAFAHMIDDELRKHRRPDGKD